MAAWKHQLIYSHGYLSINHRKQEKWNVRPASHLNSASIFLCWKMFGIGLLTGFDLNVDYDFSITVGTNLQLCASKMTANRFRHS